MAIEVTSETNTNRKTITGTAADLIALVAGAAGVAVPDFGTGEADAAVIKLADGLGNEVFADILGSGSFSVSLVDEEPAA